MPGDLYVQIFFLDDFVAACASANRIYLQDQMRTSRAADGLTHGSTSLLLTAQPPDAPLHVCRFVVERIQLSIVASTRDEQARGVVNRALQAKQWLADHLRGVIPGVSILPGVLLIPGMLAELPTILTEQELWVIKGDQIVRVEPQS